MAQRRYLRPGAQVFWRRPGESQIGVDPRCAVVVDGLDPVEQGLLEQLPRLGGEPDLDVYARELGVGRAPVRRLLDRLAGTGLLVTQPPLLDGPDDRYWHLAEVAGHPRPLRRGEACVLVRGLDLLGLRVARILAQAGVGRLLLEDDAVVGLDDLAPDGYRGSDLGHPRRQQAFRLLRAGSPMTALTAPAGTRPDLVVLVAHGAVDPVVVRPLVRDDLPHLPVLVRELDVVVGPLVRPGQGPCLRCLDLHRTDDDPRWPAVATQLTGSPPTGVETSLGWLAAAVAAHQALAVVDGRGVLLASASLEVSATYPLPRYREWAVHPACGCGGVDPTEMATEAVRPETEESPSSTTAGIDGRSRPS